jgi:hypothetical protein
MLVRVADDQPPVLSHAHRGTCMIGGTRLRDKADEVCEQQAERAGVKD